LEMKGDIFSDNEWARVWLPYQFVKISANGRNGYLPVNRRYKPLGVNSGEWVNYEDYANQAVFFATDPKTFKDVWHASAELYLYSDDPDTRKDYFERLERLLKKSMKLAKEG
jgi:hypothetical protein